jgi:hypothetical protein
MAIDPALIDKLPSDYKTPEDELTEHLGYERHEPVGRNSGNSLETSAAAAQSSCPPPGCARTAPPPPL